jgi:hypothetical protein
MPDPVTGIGAAVSIGGSVLKGNAAKKAGQQQVQSEREAIAEQRAAREETRRLLEPYVSAGTPALQQQMAALGLSGAEAQAAYVAQQEQSPIFQALTRQGEEAMAQSASATGGLRGGNFQGALAQFRPALLNQFLEQQYGRLGGMAQMGQASATGVAAAGRETAQNIGGNLQNIGAQRAGSSLAQGQMFGDILGSFGGVAKGLFG